MRTHRTAAIALVVFGYLLFTSATAHAAPKAVLGIDKLDFGTVLRGDVAEDKIPVRNDGDAPFTILKVNASCPCVLIETPPANEATIQPGKTYELRVRYDSKDRVGPQGAVVAVMTDDPANPALTLDITAFVEALVVVRPPNGIVWGYVARGNPLTKSLEIAPGNVKNDIELIELKVNQPGVTVTTEKAERGGERFIRATFAIDKTVPLGTFDAQILAKVRVAGEDAEITAPFHGEIVGDVLVSPPAINSPKTAYALGQKISEITVSASAKDAPPPKLLGAMAVGNVKTIIVKSADPAAHTIAIHASDNVPAGPQTGTVYIMTDSPDQPITAVPVYFRMGESVRVEPATVAIKSGAQQTVTLKPAKDGALKIVNLAFEKDIVNVETIPADQNATGPASIRITALTPASPDKLSTIVAIETDAPGGARIYVPVAITP